MPYVKLKLVEGRSLDIKRKLVEEVTTAITNVLDVSKDDVRIELIELNQELFSIGGQLVTDKRQSKGGE
ncbi:4-oxalocrotonate tautomerase [Lysinibacillus antri]|uniref:4-oxalocrotonate tautomerase n=2 Tax=Bacillaceae TaxID=186817 RepID=A0A3S0RTM6_9BACI|nr:tautomerase family protein [Lysinibacillus antri]RUL47781.1 4-oxalocrotonate tautomerase [Lysinibacillus antri]TSI08328.1 4-oxalocrotonate tautomerase [Lysinibacillus sp. BW-2-10]